MDGVTVRKSSTRVTPGSPIEVEASEYDRYVSRAALKLLGAVDALTPHGLTIRGRRCLDAGSSTGGFTQVLLEHGAASVVAVDVGTGQLADPLRRDPRVEVHEQTNLRHAEPGQFGPLADLVVADLSFISLRLVLAELRGLATSDADFLLMVKPQFEVGRAELGSGGVVREPELRAAAVLAVAEDAWALGLGTRAVVRSALPGGSGNVEVFCWFTAGAPTADPAAVRAAAGAAS